ncbi:MAG: (2Fe-2S)-binding protein [Gammaproteobacteria bacterium]
MIELNVNGIAHALDVEPEMPLLWALRDQLGLTGTKYGCGMALCGACAVHVDGRVMRACVLPVSAVAGARIVTIEGVASDAAAPAARAVGAAVQRAWLAEDVPQCGYCQSGQIMAATALLSVTPTPTDEDVDAAMTHICRCGTYSRIRRAVHRAAASLKP